MRYPDDVSRPLTATAAALRGLPRVRLPEVQVGTRFIPTTVPINAVSRYANRRVMYFGVGPGDRFLEMAFARSFSPHILTILGV